MVFHRESFTNKRQNTGSPLLINLFESIDLNVIHSDFTMTGKSIMFPVKNF